MDPKKTKRIRAIAAGIIILLVLGGAWYALRRGGIEQKENLSREEAVSRMTAPDRPIDPKEIEKELQFLKSGKR